MERKFVHILRDETKKRKWIPYVLFFIFAMYFFGILQLNYKFLDPDSFYHAKMAELMKEHGIIREFPWLPYTILQESFTDHHLLYHVALIPFILFLPPLMGLKLATVVFSSLTIVVLYWFFKKIGIRGAWFFVLLSIFDSSFIFRLNLAKAQALAISNFFLVYYFVIKRKLVLLFIFSFLYVWLYGGWPLVLILVFFDIISKIPEVFEKRVLTKKYHLNREKLRQKIRADIQLVAVACSGLVSGIVINPYFPKNLIFYWNQTVKIALLNYQSSIGVGNEWSPYAPFELITNSSIAIIMLIVAVTFLVINIKKRNSLVINLFLSTLLFFILTMKSRRNVEYLIPCMLAFSGAALTAIFQEYSAKNLWQEFRIFLKEQKIFLFALVIPAIMLPYIIARDYVYVIRYYNQGLEFDKYKGAMGWLKENSAAGAIVFHSDWDEFPNLFYHNSHNYYIVGLDTRFFFGKNPELYGKWDRITRGQEIEKIYPIIKEDFKAGYVFVDIKRHEDMDKNLQNNFKFKEVYKDDDTKIYQVL